MDEELSDFNKKLKTALNWDPKTGHRPEIKKTREPPMELIKFIFHTFGNEIKKSEKEVEKMYERYLKKYSKGG